MRIILTFVLVCGLLLGSGIAQNDELMDMERLNGRVAALANTLFKHHGEFIEFRTWSNKWGDQMERMGVRHYKGLKALRKELKALRKELEEVRHTMLRLDTDQGKTLDRLEREIKKKR